MIKKVAIQNKLHPIAMKEKESKEQWESLKTEVYNAAFCLGINNGLDIFQADFSIKHIK